MTYKVDWDIPGKVLQLKMHGDMPFDAFVEIDMKINECLQEAGDLIALIVDASDANIAPYSIERIKSTQKYIESRQIERLVVVVDNKLNRLVMLLLFNLCRPRLQFCASIDEANQILGMSRS